MKEFEGQVVAEGAIQVVTWVNYMPDLGLDGVYAFADRAREPGMQMAFVDTPKGRALVLYRILTGSKMPRRLTKALAAAMKKRV